MHSHDLIALPRDIVADIKRSGQQNTEDKNKKTGVDRLITLFVDSAITYRASDIHIEPLENCAIVRFRVDGMLLRMCEMELDIYMPLVSKIKILSNMDIAEKRKPQDGRIGLDVSGRRVDLRVSTLPTITGESVAVRILDKSADVVAFEELGISSENLDKFRKSIKSPHGIILVTGPTGSGKTTTLYSAINQIKNVSKKIITVEDPVEYRLELVQQVQVNDKAGLGFANALRSILRQDPDVLMIGEIRDQETLRIAVQSSLTGHLVFSTLHTNDAISSIGRMLDMGLESYLLGSSLRAILSQRLLRKLCNECKQQVDRSTLPDELSVCFPQDATIFAACGCDRCSGSGYFGREVISELLVVSSQMAQMIAKNMPIEKIKEQALSEGFVTKFDDGVSKVASGITSLEELLRVVWYEAV